MINVLISSIVIIFIRWRIFVITVYSTPLYFISSLSRSWELREMQLLATEFLRSSGHWYLVFSVLASIKRGSVSLHLAHGKCLNTCLALHPCCCCSCSYDKQKIDYCLFSSILFHASPHLFLVPQHQADWQSCSAAQCHPELKKRTRPARGREQEQKCDRNSVGWMGLMFVQTALAFAGNRKYRWRR